MKQNNIIRFVQSLVLLPVVAGTMPLGNLPNIPKAETFHIAIIQKLNTKPSSLLAFNQADEDKAKLLKAQGDAIDAYFKFKNMPLQGTGLMMAIAADENGLDWRLLPAISARESTGGRESCKGVGHNFFGWRSCAVGFNSDKEAIDFVAKHLGGNGSGISSYYAGKTTEQILRKYNSVIPKYVIQVVKMMNDIGDKYITLPANA